MNNKELLEKILTKLIEEKIKWDVPGQNPGDDFAWGRVCSFVDAISIVRSFEGKVK